MMPGELDGLATLARLRESVPDVPVIMMSGKAGLSDAVKATKLGAFNFLEKPLTPEGVLLALASALELRRVRREARALREDLGLAGEMIGDSPAMARVRELIARVAPTDARVLVTGESGTGKELVAAAIHLGSARRDRPFVRVNCAAIPRDLVESEMFGHEKGAFTGATDRRIGRFELAHTGTLFLDEVGDLGRRSAGEAAARDRGEGDRARGRREADSRRRAHRERDESRPRRAPWPTGSFREDLLFRLNVIPIEVPPLRERPDDIPALVRALLRAAPHAHGTPRAAVDARARWRCWRAIAGRATCASWRTSWSDSRSCTPAATWTSRTCARCCRSTAACAAPIRCPIRRRSTLAERHAGRARAHADRARAVGGGRQCGGGVAAAEDGSREPVSAHAPARHPGRRRMIASGRYDSADAIGT